MNYCELCNGEIEKDNVHPYCLNYYLKQEHLTTKEIKVALNNQEDILEIYA